MNKQTVDDQKIQQVVDSLSVLLYISFCGFMYKGNVKKTVPIYGCTLLEGKEKLLPLQIY